MNGRQFLGSFQLPVAMTGAGLAALGYRKLVTLPPPGRGGLFGPGIAILFLALVIWIGLLGLPLGLLIPPAGGYGIEFTSAQRRLLGWTVITVTTGPLVGIGLAFVTPWIVARTLTVSMCTTLVPLVVAVGWRAGETIRSHTG